MKFLPISQAHGSCLVALGAPDLLRFRPCPAVRKGRRRKGDPRYLLLEVRPWESLGRMGSSR